MMYKKYALATLLTSTLLASTFTPIYAKSATPVTPYSYELNYAQKEGYYSPSHGSTVTRQGTTFVAMNDWLTDQSGLQITWDQSGTRASLDGFIKKIAVRVGSRTALLDHQKVTLSAAPFKAIDPLSEKAELYLPIRFVVQALGGTQLRIDAANHKLVADHLQSLNVLKDSYQGTTYAVKKANGDIYIAQGKNLAKRIASINETLDLADIEVTATPKGLRIMRIGDSYGEPHINYQDFTLIFKNGALIRQSHMNYHWGVGTNIEMYNGNIVLNDGQTLRIIEDGTGKVIDTIDLFKLGGGKDTYTVEGLQPDFIVVRSIKNTHLTLIDRQTGKSVILYKELLNANQQEQVENDTPPMGRDDRLTYVKRNGNTLYFTYDKGSKNEKKLTYTLK